MFLDRRLFTATTYPADYGFIPETLGGDGDPLDALVLLEDPVYPGVWVEARPVGVLYMHDEAGEDAKIICVPPKEPRWHDVHDLDDLTPQLVSEIQHFFLDRYIPSYVEEWKAFVGYIADGGPSPVSAEDGRAPLVIGLAAWKSYHEGRPVRCDEIG